MQAGQRALGLGRWSSAWHPANPASPDRTTLGMCKDGTFGARGSRHRMHAAHLVSGLADASIALPPAEKVRGTSHVECTLGKGRVFIRHR